MKKYIALFFIIIVLFSCRTTPKSSSLSYDVLVNGLATEDDYSKDIYCIRPANKDDSENSLQFLEFAKYIKRALKFHNYTITDDLKKATAVVFLSYGVGDPIKHDYSYSLPVWGKTGIASSVTYGNRTTYYPSYGIIGSERINTTYTTYDMFISLDTFDLKFFKKNNKMRQLWSTLIKSVNTYADFREAFPIMIGGALESISFDTGQAELYKVYDNYKDVVYIKTGNFPLDTE